MIFYDVGMSFLSLPGVKGLTVQSHSNPTPFRILRENPMHTQKVSHAACQKRKRGFTLTEIAIVLGIIGLILGAIWGAASAVYANKKVADTEQGITAAAAAVRSLYASANGNTGQTAVATLTTPGMFPVSWNSTTAGQYNNPFNPALAGSAYVLASANAGTQFGIELDGLSAQGCAALVSYFSSSASSVNGGQIVGLISSSAGGSQPAAGTPKTNTVAASGTYNSTPATSCVTTAATGGFAGIDNVVIGFDMAKM
jgi:prepilin-type N-terminal cleavage/methylation domain-containing protein